MKPLVIILAAGLIGLAEFGDKTQLTTITLAIKYPPKKVFLGVFCSFAVLTVLAISIGTIIFKLIPQTWLKIIAGSFFVIFGIYTFIKAKEQDSVEEIKKKGDPFWVSFSLIFLNELGDKTQLLTVALAAKYKAPIEVLIGALIGLGGLALIGILLGKAINRLVKDVTLIHRLSGIIFLILGIFMLAKG